MEGLENQFAFVREIMLIPALLVSPIKTPSPGYSHGFPLNLNSQQQPSTSPSLWIPFGQHAIAACLTRGMISAGKPISRNASYRESWRHAMAGNGGGGGRRVSG
jgi:hypothetical protein